MVCKIGDFIVQIDARFFFEEKPNEKATMYLIQDLQHAFEDAAKFQDNAGWRRILAHRSRDAAHDCYKTLANHGYYDKKGEDENAVL